MKMMIADENEASWDLFFEDDTVEASDFKWMADHLACTVGELRQAAKSKDISHNSIEKRPWTTAKVAGYPDAVVALTPQLKMELVLEELLSSYPDSARVEIS